MELKYLLLTQKEINRFKRNVADANLIRKCVIGYLGNRKLYPPENSPWENPFIENCPSKNSPVENCPRTNCPFEDCPRKISSKKDCPLSPLEICPQQNCSWKTAKFDLFCSTKDKMPTLNYSFVVYEFVCPGCNANYISKTERPLLKKCWICLEWKR